jgi:hypothetical protein
VNPRSHSRRIIWLHVLTVSSATILIGAEVFGLSFAGSWAIASLLELGDWGHYAVQVVMFLVGLATMVQFVRSAQRVEPFTTRD